MHTLNKLLILFEQSLPMKVQLIVGSPWEFETRWGCSGLGTGISDGSSSFWSWAQLVA